jgi:AcrR family transcriptional regulator
MTEPKQDGRLLRTQRSRQAILDAAFQLMHTDGIMPTAQVIADRAGVTIRTLFRHFPEMDFLYREMHELTFEAYAKEYQKGDKTGTLEQRVSNAVVTFTNAYSKMRNIFLVTKSMLRGSPFLRENYAKAQKNLSKRLLDWLPELAAMPDDTHDAVDGLLSFEFWHRLHVIQGMSKKRTVSLIQTMVLDQMQNQK